MRYVLALDQGTTSSRALLFDEAGRIVATAQREFEQHFPEPGWVEHDPADLWTSQRDTAREVLEQAGVARGDLAAIGLTNQRETTLVWERDTGQPIHRAIVWQDRRTADACASMRGHGDEAEVQQQTGLRLDPYFSATKAAWILDHADGARARAEAGELCFGTVDTWLVWHLSDGTKHVTDATNASRTLLYDLNTGDWSDALCERFGVPRTMLPDVVDTAGVIAELGDALGPAARGVPLASVVGDQQAALFGQACVEPGMAKVTYGTGCFALLHTGNQPQHSEHRLLTTVAAQHDGKRTFALEGSVFIGGAVVQWLRDGLGLIESAEQIEALANSVEDTGGVVLVPAFAGLGAPHWDADARGAIVGLTRGTTAAHLARAALESIALQVGDVMRAMRDDAGELQELRVDGGAARNNLLMQLQADVLGVPVIRPQVTETTAAGAAFLAGRAVGFWADDDAVAACWQAERRFEPAMPPPEVEALQTRWNEAVRRCRGWSDGDTSA